MALWSAALMIVVAAATLHGSPALAATKHVVGGTTGWTIPPNATFYSAWAATQSFAVGNTLEFDFTTGFHDVTRVPKSGYDACSATNKIGSTLTTGPATVTLTAAGTYYFFCGFTGHCSTGQKIAVTVASSHSSGAKSPPPVAAAPAPGSTPPSTAGNSLPAVTASPGPTPPATAGGGNSAAPGTPSGFRAAVGSAVLVVGLSLVV